MAIKQIEQVLSSTPVSDVEMNKRFQTIQENDTGLQSQIENETALRVQQDTTLQTNISNETATRQQADINLQNAINENSNKITVLQTDKADKIGSVKSLAQSVFTGHNANNDLSNGVNSFYTNSVQFPETQNNPCAGWVNYLNFGANNRMTQIASQAFYNENQSKFFIRSCHDAVWGSWKQLATTEKIPFLVTPLTNTTIEYQNCYKINNHVYINAVIKRTDNGAYSIPNYVLSVPFTNRDMSYPCTVTGLKSLNANAQTDVAVAFVHNGSGNIVAGATGTNTFYLNISCDYEL